MDLGGVDVWGQIAVETSQMFVSEGGVIKSRFAGTVSDQSYRERVREKETERFDVSVPDCFSQTVSTRLLSLIFLDDRKAAGQSAAERLLLPVSS